MGAVSRHFAALGKGAIQSYVILAKLCCALQRCPDNTDLATSRLAGGGKGVKQTCAGVNSDSELYYLVNGLHHGPLRMHLQYNQHVSRRQQAQVERT
jgi:hypothetical protein